MSQGILERVQSLQTQWPTFLGMKSLEAAFPEGQPASRGFGESWFGHGQGGFLCVLSPLCPQVLPHFPLGAAPAPQVPFSGFYPGKFSSSSLQNEVLRTVSTTPAIPPGAAPHPRGWRQRVRTCGKIPRSSRLRLELLKTQKRSRNSGKRR